MRVCLACYIFRLEMSQYTSVVEDCKYVFQSPSKEEDSMISQADVQRRTAVRFDVIKHDQATVISYTN